MKQLRIYQERTNLSNSIKLSLQISEIEFKSDGVIGIELNLKDLDELESTVELVKSVAPDSEFQVKENGVWFSYGYSNEEYSKFKVDIETFGGKFTDVGDLDAGLFNLVVRESIDNDKSDGGFPLSKSAKNRKLARVYKVLNKYFGTLHTQYYIRNK